MGVFAGPEIVEDGLVLALDAGNSKKSYKTDNNLIPPDTWAVSNFTAPSGWGNFGTTTENELKLELDPFGNTAVVWEGSCDANGSSGSDGGYVSSFVGIDTTKTYRVSAWVNRVVLGTDGRSYHGIDCRNVGAAQTETIYRQSGTESLYPYFFYTSDPPPSDESELPEDEWVLIVGHIWPAGSGTGSSKPDTGMYNTDGTKRTITTGLPPQDLVFKSTAHEIRIKNMLYYNATDSTVTARSVYPRIDLVDGTEPSIDDLINNRVNDRYWYDITNGGNERPLINGISYSSSDNGMLTFDGSDDYMDFYAPNLGTTTTVEMWCKLKSLSNVMPFGWFQYDVFCSGGGIGYNTANSDRYGLTSTQVTNLGLLNNWKHYVFEMRSDVSYTNNKIYVNGEEQSLSQLVGTENSGNRSFNNGNGRISGWRADDNYRMSMDCASFKVYNRALTASEIQQNFNALRGRFSI